MKKCEYLGQVKLLTGFGPENGLIGKSFKFENDIEVIKWSNGNYERFDDNKLSVADDDVYIKAIDCDVDNEFVVTSEYIEAIEKMEKEELMSNMKIYIFSNGVQTFTAFTYDEVCWIVDGKQSKEDIYDFLDEFGCIINRPKVYDHHFDLKCADYYLGEDFESDLLVWTVDDAIPDSKFVYGEEFDDYCLNLFIKKCNDNGFMAVWPSHFEEE